MKLLLLMGLMGFGLLAQQNTLTPREKQQGFHLLFDGKTFHNWRDPATETPPGDSWVIEDGTLHTKVQPHISEDLVSAETYGDFELKFDWKVSLGANTGVKYRIQKFIFIDHTKTQKNVSFERSVGYELEHHLSDRAKLAPNAHAQVYVVGYEFQLIDDKRHPDAKKDASHITGALYSFIPPQRHSAHPAGEWNESRLIVKGNHVEHWINGEKVLDASLDDPVIARRAQLRWAEAPEVRDMLAHPAARGPISLQHHGDLVWFRNLKIRTLK